MSQAITRLACNIVTHFFPILRLGDTNRNFDAVLPKQPDYSGSRLDERAFSTDFQSPAANKTDVQRFALQYKGETLRMPSKERLLEKLLEHRLCGEATAKVIVNQVADREVSYLELLKDVKVALALREYDAPVSDEKLGADTKRIALTVASCAEARVFEFTPRSKL
jgi:hypothetical protein